MLVGTVKEIKEAERRVGLTPASVRELVEMFDVDWLAGMSFAMFPLEYADAVTVVEEIETIIDSGGDTPLAGIVRVLPIERVNGVLVITHRPDHLYRHQRRPLHERARDQRPLRG